MKRKLLVFLALLGLICWASVAGATPCDFYLTSANISGPLINSPFAEVIVTTNGTTATIEIKALDTYYFDQAGVNLAINSDPTTNGYAFVSASAQRIHH